jgi:GH35 family endo-1,4-beta-xylanase
VAEAAASRWLQLPRRHRRHRHSAHISTVTVWGPSDDNSWLNYFFTVRNDWPLLFDRQLQAKPAYWGIVDPTYLTAAPLWVRSMADRR